MPENKSITCVDCGKEFLWEGREQLFYKSMGLEHPPKRCRTCREKKKKRFNDHDRGAETSS